MSAKKYARQKAKEMLDKATEVLKDVGEPEGPPVEEPGKTSQTFKPKKEKPAKPPKPLGPAYDW